MDLRFVLPDLRRLDQLSSEVLVIPVVEGQRPPRGVLGLVDYRLGGHVSELLKSGTITGAPLEQLLLSGRPRLTFDKIFLVGVGRAEGFHPQIYAAALDVILRTLGNWGVRRAVVELPGRAAELIAPDLAVDILLERAEAFPDFDVWTLVDTADAARAVNVSGRRDPKKDWGVGEWGRGR